MAGHDKITPEGKKFLKQIEELKKLQVRVGYQKGVAKKKNKKNDVDMLDIAAFNELGTARSPARPFIRQSVDRNKDTIEKVCKAQLRQVAKGGTAKQALNAIGVIQRGLIQDTVSESKSWAKPNAPSTVKRKKGSDVPLIDKGDLREKASYVIVPKGGGG